MKKSINSSEGRSGLKGFEQGLGRIWSDLDGLPRLSPHRVLFYTFTGAIKSMAASPITAILSSITIIASLIVLAFFVLLLENLRTALADVQADLLVSIYLEDNVSNQRIDQLLVLIAENPNVADAEYVSSEKALKQFRNALGDQALILDGLDEHNPLPASIEVQLARSHDFETVFRSFADSFQSEAGVEHIQYSSALLSRLGVFMKWFGLLAAGLIVLVIALISFVISNTVRLAVYSHRAEIEIMRLVGATNRFIRAPFMIEGAVQGISGAVLAIFLLYVLFALLMGTFEGLSLFDTGLFNINFLSYTGMALVILSGLTAGLIGSFFSLRKFIGR